MRLVIGLMVTIGLIGLSGCSSMPETVEKKAILSAEVEEAIAIFRDRDPSIEILFKHSYGYAVLPRIFKGAFWVGGAHGKGHVFEQGNMTGFCSMSQATLGLSFGGEFFREIIFFENKTDLDAFKSEEYTFSAQITGVALTTGAAAKANYHQGMIVFTATDSGLMIDASLGGQKFRYIPKIMN